MAVEREELRDARHVASEPDHRRHVALVRLLVHEPDEREEHPGHDAVRDT